MPSENTTPAITLTKLQRPRVGRHLVARPHLLEQLTASQTLTLVIAPAGGGKTTLLSSWLETCNLPNAWLALDERSNDLGLFATYLITALRTLFPVANNTLAAVSGLALPPPDAIARSLLNDLAAVEQDFVLVLDDYQVIRDQAIHELITEIVLHPPRTLRLVIAARQDPPLPLAALRGRGDVMELRKADLWFTPEETRRFLVESMRLTLDESTIAGLIANIGGWPVALRLAALSLRRRPAAMLVLDAQRDYRYITDYLAAEVLSHQPVAIQEFLIKTSLLDQLHGSLCEAVTGMDGTMASGQPILEWLEYSDLFVTSAEDRRRWYRYHDLFRHFLRARLEQTYSPAEIAALHLHASAWFGAHGYLEEALQHALSGHDMEAAVRLIAEHRPALMDAEMWQRQERILHMFPADAIARFPDLLMMAAETATMQHSGWERFPDLLNQAESLLAQMPDPSEHAVHLKGEIDALRGYVIYEATADPENAIAVGLRALATLPRTWYYVRAQARGYLAVAYQTVDRLDQAYTTLDEGEPEDVAPDGAVYARVGGFRCFVQWIAGDLPAVARGGARLQAVSEAHRRFESLGWGHYLLGSVFYEWNDLAAAETHAQSLAGLRYVTRPMAVIQGVFMHALLLQARGQPEEARKKLAEGFDFLKETDSYGFLPLAEAFQAELAARQGDLAAASKWATTIGPHVPLAGMPYFYAPQLTLSKILLAQDTPASLVQAGEALARLHAFVTATHNTRFTIEVLALQALLHHAQGNKPSALAALEQAVTLAQPGGFLRLFVDLGPALTPLLQGLARQGVAPAYIHEILAAFGPDEAPPTVAQLLTAEPVLTPPGSTLLTHRELDVLQLLARRCSDKEIAEALVISPRTVSSHIDHLGDKLGVRGRRAIVEAARAQGLLT